MEPSLKVEFLMQAIKTALNIGLDTEFGRRIIQAAYNAVLEEREAGKGQANG